MIVAKLDPGPDREELPWWMEQLRERVKVRGWGGSPDRLTSIGRLAGARARRWGYGPDGEAGAGWVLRRGVRHRFRVATERAEAPRPPPLLHPERDKSPIPGTTARAATT